ncbi:MAG: 3-oxoacyl-ACP synthase, partial [Opitutae bacterium]|nr:3-oxoacyl-ACP synthase [Opitutae bacterium]
MSDSLMTSDSSAIVMLGLGSHAPANRLTNLELSKRVDTSDDWIFSRTGISERRIASDEETTSDLALHAAQNALKDADASPEEIDLVVVATITPDMAFP